MSSLYIGFMSGTSLDGLDASLILTDGKLHCECLDNIHIPYNIEFRTRVKKFFDYNIDCKSSDPYYIEELLELEKSLTLYHVDATLHLLKKNHLTSDSIEALGLHGQTIFHKPKSDITMQIGNPYILANKTSINVIHDFRRNDIALGGNGAPLVPIFHKLIAQHLEPPVVIVNIGGVSNITYIDQDNLIAFDTGPGNALIDDAMTTHFNQSFDNNGNIASSGVVDKDLACQFLQNEYFYIDYPKSIDRNHFQFIYAMFKDHSPSSIVATLTYITAMTIAHSVAQLPKAPNKILLSGGGSRNTQMVKWLAKLLISHKIHCTIEDVSCIDGYDAEYVESQAFGYLAARFLNNLPSAFPNTTGAIQENICGCLVKYTRSIV